MSSIALFAMLFASQAQAQDRNAAASSARAKKDSVREVVKGFFVKANLGTSAFVGSYGSSCGTAIRGGGSCLSPVMATGLSLGSDFVDKERLSLGWEVTFGQQLHNGPRGDEVLLLPAGNFIQGDIHTLHGVATVEGSFYLTRRLGLGVRGGGGVMMVPLLVDAQYYQSDIVAIWGATSPVHEGILPVVIGGPTVEYYTKLSHFSVGVDIDAMLVIGLDLGLGGSGYLKYTF